MENQDCIIIGESPGGLWGAKQLLEKGMKVLILPTGTSRIIQALPKKIVDEFEIPVRYFIDREAFPLQVITRNRRFRVFPDEQSFKAEYQFNYGREFNPNTPPEADLYRGLAYWQKGAEAGPLFPDEWPLIQSRLIETIHFDRAPGLVEQWMLSYLEKKGATIAPPHRLKQIFVDKNKMVGVQLSETSKMIPAKSVWINTHFDYVNQFINEPLPMKSRPMAWVFEVQVECAIDFLPVGCTDRMVYIEAGAPPLEIEQESPGSFRLRTLFPMEEGSLDRGNQWRLATRMLRVMGGLFPDLEYNLKHSTPDLRDAEQAQKTELPALYPFDELRKIPSHLLCFGSDAGLGFQTPVSGLMITNSEAFPRQGIWGGFEAAQKAILDGEKAKNNAAQ